MDVTQPEPKTPGEALTAHQQQTRKLVRSMMAITGRSASRLAILAGLTPSTINRFMHKPVRHTLSQRTMLALLTKTFLYLQGLQREDWDTIALSNLIPALAVYEQGILELEPGVETILKQVRASQNAEVNTNSRSHVATLPVVLVSSQGMDVSAGNFEYAPMHTPRPPFLFDDPLAFAILMPDDTLIPRYDAGDMLYVSPSYAIESPKADVVLETTKGGFVIGQLIAATDQLISISTLYPLASKFYDREKLKGLYRIVGMQRL